VGTHDPNAIDARVDLAEQDSPWFDGLLVRSDLLTEDKLWDTGRMSWNAVQLESFER
jgi:hypothetical protein